MKLRSITGAFALGIAAFQGQIARADEIEYVGRGYAELHGGTERFSSEFDDSNGGVYGGALGYDFYRGSFVVGGSVGIDFSTNDYVEVKDFRGSRNYEFEATAKRDIEVAGRAGLLLMNSLVYGKIAYANGRFRVNDGEDHAPFRGSRNLNGIRIAGGIELPVSHRIHAKAEYRYTRYSYNLSRTQFIGGMVMRF